MQVPAGCKLGVPAGRRSGGSVARPPARRRRGLRLAPPDVPGAAIRLALSTPLRHGTALLRNDLATRTDTATVISCLEGTRPLDGAAPAMESIPAPRRVVGGFGRALLHWEDAGLRQQAAYDVEVQALPTFAQHDHCRTVSRYSLHLDNWKRLERFRLRQARGSSLEIEGELRLRDCVL